MNRGLKITFWVLGLLILIGALSYGGWQIWTLMQQAEATRVLHAQERDALKAQITKLGEEITEKLNTEITAVATVQSTALSATEKKLQDSLTEARQKTEALSETQTKDQESVKALATTISTLEQAHQKLAQDQAQFGQKVAAKETQVNEKFTGLSTALNSLTKRTDNIVATEADWHYFSGVDKWDDSDLNGAIRQFARTCKLNPKLASAHYNLALALWRNGQLPEGCQSAYNAGQRYLAKGDLKQANRMLLLISTIDPLSPLAIKFRQELAAQTKTLPAIPTSTLMTTPEALATPALLPAAVDPAPADPIQTTATADPIVPEELADPIVPEIPEAPAMPAAPADSEPVIMPEVEAPPVAQEAEPEAEAPEALVVPETPAASPVPFQDNTETMIITEQGAED